MKHLLSICFAVGFLIVEKQNGTPTRPDPTRGVATEDVVSLSTSSHSSSTNDVETVGVAREAHPADVLTAEVDLLDESAAYHRKAIGEAQALVRWHRDALAATELRRARLLGEGRAA